MPTVGFEVANPVLGGFQIERAQV